MYCRNCNSLKLKRIVNMGKQPISSIFYRSIKKKLHKYSLDLFICKVCTLVQFKKSTPIKEMYGLNYGYQSNLSQSMIKHLEKKFLFLKKNFLKRKSSILDIGSNDGTFLNLFGKNSFLVGIDPSIKKFYKNYKKNIITINNYFSFKNIKKNIFNKNQESKFDLISSFAIFYDIEDPNSFCSDINKLLKKDGIWVVEFSYLPLMLKNLTFDQICHEHVTYYSLTVFNEIIKNNNLKIVNIKLNEINGGSIEIICSKKDSKFKEKKKKLEKIFKDENKINFKSFKNFENQIKKSNNLFKTFIKKIKSKKIEGYGASTKGNIVLNHFKITNKIVPFICDANKFKKGRFTPGTNIKIITKEKMRLNNPDYLLVLIWPFRSEVIKEEINYIKKGGSLVFLLPRFHIINKFNYRNFIKKDFKSMSYKY